VDYKFFGDWKDHGDFTTTTPRRNVLVVGAGVHASQQSNSTTLHYTVDAQWKMAQKLSLFGAVYGRHLETRNTLIGGRDDIGGMAQIGYELTRSLEVFGRYSLAALDSDFVAAGSPRQIHELTGGINWYMGPDGSWASCEDHAGRDVFAERQPGQRRQHGHPQQRREERRSAVQRTVAVVDLDAGVDEVKFYL